MYIPWESNTKYCMSKNKAFFLTSGIRFTNTHFWICLSASIKTVRKNSWMLVSHIFVLIAGKCQSIPVWTLIPWFFHCPNNIIVNSNFNVWNHCNCSKKNPKGSMRLFLVLETSIEQSITFCKDYFWSLKLRNIKRKFEN